MTPHIVMFTPEAQEQLVSLYQYISVAASPEIAERYTEAIIAHCERLQDFPHRGTRRDDVRPGLRITNYKTARSTHLRWMQNGYPSSAFITAAKIMNLPCFQNWMNSATQLE